MAALCAEGYAAMADAVLPATASVLKLDAAEPDVSTKPVTPLMPRQGQR
jgi:hypothetical protein